MEQLHCRDSIEGTCSLEESTLKAQGAVSLGVPGLISNLSTVTDQWLSSILDLNLGAISMPRIINEKTTWLTVRPL